MITEKIKKTPVRVLLTALSDESRDVISQLAATPEVTLHVDYDDSDKDDKFKLDALSLILNDINTEKQARSSTAFVNYENVYKAIAELKTALSNAGI